jgi:SpoIIAA-like
MLELIQDMPDNIVAVRASGQISGQDYDEVLIPAVESGVKRHGKIRVLYQLSPDFSGFTAGAMFDDARLGIRHLTEFEKIAVVTDADWISRAVQFFSLFMPCPVKIFGNHDISEAKAWLIE